MDTRSCSARPTPTSSFGYMVSGRPSGRRGRKRWRNKPNWEVGVTISAAPASNYPVGMMMVRRRRWRRLRKKTDYPDYCEKAVVAHTQEEINYLYQQCEDDNDWFFLSFMLGTGLREGEAMHAETSDLVGTTLLVQRKNKFDWRPKKCHVRKVEITPALAAAIKSRPQGLLFRNTQCNPDGHLLRRLQRLAKGGGFDVELHKLRKSWASHSYL